MHGDERPRDESGGGSLGKLLANPECRLKYQLALRLGRTVAQLEAEMSAAEWAHWRAFDLIDPVGDDRVSGLLAQLLTYAHNLWTNTDQTGGKRAPDYFQPWLGTRKATLSEIDAGAIELEPWLREVRERLREEGE